MGMDRGNPDADGQPGPSAIGSTASGFARAGPIRDGRRDGAEGHSGRDRRPGPAVATDGGTDRDGTSRLTRATSRTASLSLAVFALSLSFYLFLGRPNAFDVATGVASALVVSAVLARVTFVDGLSARRTGGRLLRTMAFVPYLLWEIVRASVDVAGVLLDPALPIDPSVEHLDLAATTPLERAVLANSITLTPGTVTIDVSEEELVVHCLTDASRRALREGRIQRLVRFVFHGRDRVDRTDEPGASAAGEVH